MRLPDPHQRGFALPLALTTSALLLLSSLSLQTLAFQQLAAGAQACLLALPSSEWEGSEPCPGVNPAALQSGRVVDRDWELMQWQPHGAMAGTLQLRWSDGRQSRLDLELLP